MFGLKCGGLLSGRHKTPLTQRFAVYYCAAVYTVPFELIERRDFSVFVIAVVSCNRLEIVDRAPAISIESVPIP
jgi:hypothetical protein